MGEPQRAACVWAPTVTRARAKSTRRGVGGWEGRRVRDDVRAAEVRGCATKQIARRSCNGRAAWLFARRGRCSTRNRQMLCGDRAVDVVEYRDSSRSLLPPLGGWGGALLLMPGSDNLPILCREPRRFFRGGRHKTDYQIPHRCRVFFVRVAAVFASRKGRATWDAGARVAIDTTA